MFSKGTKFYSVLHRKCPHCHEGEFMVTRNPYDLTLTGDLLPGCSVCHRKYQPEPGFYYGGMYVTYALSVGLCIAIFIATLVLAPDISAVDQILWILGALVVLAPPIYAWSKIMWANMFISYKGVAHLPDEDAKWVMR